MKLIRALKDGVLVLFSVVAASLLWLLHKLTGVDFR